MELYVVVLCMTVDINKEIKYIILKFLKVRKFVLHIILSLYYVDFIHLVETCMYLKNIKKKVLPFNLFGQSCSTRTTKL